MTIPMDNTSDNISRERVQRLYNKNVELENRRRKAAQARVPSDPNSWQQMRENYEAIIIEDHAFSEQHEIEHALWQLHYRRIEELRAHFNAALSSSSAHNGRAATRPGPDRVAKIRSQFKTFLSEATGFYHDLMVKIRAKYGLPLSYFSDEPGYQNGISKDGNRSVEVKKGLVSCHRCLIYLGDLARYKGLYGEGDSKARDFAAASSYYMQASSIWPSSGNPHHQLAILASYSGDELVAVYRYFRSLAVDNPFTTARDNLIIAFEKNRQTYSQFLGEAKAASVKPAHVRMTGKGRSKGETRVPTKDSKTEELSVNEKVPTTPETFKAFGIRFVRLTGILFTRTSLETFGEVFACAKNDMLELLSSGPDQQYNFGTNFTDCGLLIVRLVAILIYTVHNVNRETENQSYAEILQRSVVLKNAFTAIFEFIGHILERCIQLTDPSSSYLMPGILIFVEWLACRQDVAVNLESEEREGNTRSFFWNNCVIFFNRLLKSVFMSGNEDEDEACFYNMSRYEEGKTENQLALTEDFELRGFSPLVPAQLILDFSRKHSYGNDGDNKEKKARIQRIIAAGKALASSVKVGQHKFYFDSKLKQFSIGVEPRFSDDIGQESLNLVVPQTAIGLLQPNAEMYVEGEEDDEVILFKPSISEKTENVIAVATFGSVSAPYVKSPQQNSFDNGSRTPPPTSLSDIRTDNVSRPPPISLSEISSPYIQPLQQNTSKWLAEEQQSLITNGFVGLNLLEYQNHAGVGLQTAAATTVPFSQTISLGAGKTYHHPFQVSETTVPSKLDYVMSSGSGGTDALHMRPPASTVTSAGLKKNPVGRPIRHFGPPPGFNVGVPHRPLDEPLSGAFSNSVQPLLDGYSWLDGHRFPKAIGFNNSVNPVVSKSSDPVGVISFPFPGKQVPNLQLQMENQNGWQEYQLSEHLKLYQQQHQQLQNGNQQSVSLPQQYQGQTLWDGRFV